MANYQNDKIYFETPRGRVVYRTYTKGMNKGKLYWRVEYNPGFGPRMTKGFSDVQEAFAHEVARKMEPYVPRDYGTLVESPDIASNWKEGLIVYATPYARRQYYTLWYHHQQDGLGLRGPRWGQRCDADNHQHFVQFSQRIAQEKLKR